MPVVDTDALVALLTPGHEHRSKAKRDLAEGAIILTWGTLVELSTVMRRIANLADRDGNQAARDAITAVTTLANFREAPAVDLAIVCALHTKNPRLSFADAWSLAVALETNERLVTYDRNLKAAYAKRA